MGDGHCVSTTSPASYSASLEAEAWDYAEEDEELLSTEGCFSCQMNAPPRARQPRTRNKSHRRRRTQRSRDRRSLAAAEAEAESGVAELGTSITVDLVLTPAQTRHRHMVARLLPARLSFKRTFAKIKV